ncbi:MAG: hypothetical protein IJ747_07475 [Lachnospiraceae bacterium]|nr:hypothetical protein [Lachnospiraceae bacterium]MBR1853224.1 hypothetical protein [Lachnospiraceae bacterium]
MNNEREKDMELNPENLDKVTGGSGDGSEGYYVGTDFSRFEERLEEGLVYFFDASGNVLGTASIEFVTEHQEYYGFEIRQDPDVWKIYYNVLDK